MDQFDILKREATKLERTLEDKVARYQQLVQSLPDPTASNDLFLAESGMGSSCHEGSTEDEAALRHDIQRTMATLQDLVDTQLQPTAERSGKSLLVKRYREILFDLSGDFEKSRQAYNRKMERAKLLGGAGSKKSSLEIHSSGMDHLMRERSHISNSQSAATAVINQAVEIRNDLRSQGMSLGRAQSMIGQIAGNVPGINTLVEQIRRKRSKDDMIVSGVIASCILFTLRYFFW